MDNEKIAMYVHWGCDNSYSNYYIIVLWSDQTWERFDTGFGEYYDGTKKDQTVFQHR